MSWQVAARQGLAANPVLARMIGPMRDMVIESHRLPITRRDRLGETLAEHRAIAVCLRISDAAMKAHLKAAADRYGVSIA